MNRENSLNQHTPGPWRECGDGRGGCTCRAVWSIAADEPVATATRRSVACVHGEWGDGPTFVYGEVPEHEVAANARLIAAAPELLAALRACEENLRLIHEALGPVPKDAPMPSHSTFGAWELASQAIAKATGTEALAALNTSTGDGQA